MIISKKKYEENMKIAIQRALNQEDERRYERERFQEQERYFNDRLEHYERRIQELERKAFPERFNQPRCPMEVTSVASF